MAAIVGIDSGCGLRNKTHCRHQVNKSKLALYKLLLSLQGSLKWVYICKMMDCLT